MTKTEENTESERNWSRRRFLKSSAAVAGLTAWGVASTVSRAHANASSVGDSIESHPADEAKAVARPSELAARRRRASRLHAGERDSVSSEGSVR